MFQVSIEGFAARRRFQLRQHEDGRVISATLFSDFYRYTT
jgi:hypothetical protein